MALEENQDYLVPKAKKEHLHLVVRREIKGMTGFLERQVLMDLQEYLA